MISWVAFEECVWLSQFLTYYTRRRYGEKKETVVGPQLPSLIACFCASGQYNGDRAQHMATRGPQHPAVLTAGCVTLGCKVMRGISL